jgi:serine/threonine protein kinase/Tol biopolymer transport system component
MGVVYKAEDTKLERTVALKFLAQHLLDDDEAKERFLREAKAAAALHHSNVCPVYEIDEVDGKTFLAMAFLQGETLEDRIAKGPLTIKEALDIARQMADGLEAAHEAGIVHRDIKPANVLIDPKGHATIMDFGLARLTEASRLTKLDTAMGTVAYMSPEQAQGMEVDHRSDVWSLGCVLYEMVSGQRPFQGQYDQALLYEIVHEQVAPLTSIRAGVPMELEFIVGKCLAKDRDDRTSAAHEVARELRTLSDKLKSGHSTVFRTAPMTGAVPATMTAGHTVNPAATLPPDAVVVDRRRLLATNAVAAVLAVAFLGVTAIHFTEAPPEAPTTPTRRFSFSQDSLTSASISPDGRYVAFATGARPESSLWLRAIGTETAREIPGTEGARPQLDWSPDSQAIVFATTTEIKRVLIDGGDPITLGGLPGTGGLGFMGVSWSPDGERIVFSSTGGALYEVPARGGEPKSVLGENGSGHVEPHFLPAGAGPAALVYELDSQMWVWNRETDEQTEIGPGSAPVCSRDGYLIHGSGEAGGPGLFALPFSLASLRPTGEAFPIAEEGQFASVARDGTLVFLDGNAALALSTLVWRNRDGELLERIGQPQPGMGGPALSPDGQRIALQSSDSGIRDIWIHDLIRSTKTRLTFADTSESQPAWSPSGQEIAYQSFGGPEGTSLTTKTTDGTGEAVVLIQAEGLLAAHPDWSQDGRYLVYYESSQETQRDIHYLEFGPDGVPGESVTFLNTPAQERMPKLSPAGGYLAYDSDESGRHEIYVRQFPDGAGKWQVSVNGGAQPRWRHDGKELYFVEGDALKAVSVSTEQGFALGQPQVLFEAPGWACRTSAALPTTSPPTASASSRLRPSNRTMKSPPRPRSASSRTVTKSSGTGSSRNLQKFSLDLLSPSSFLQVLPAQPVNATPVLSRSARTRQPQSRQVISGSRVQPRNSL